MTGIFTISLDFELHWGGFEKWPLEKYRSYFLNTRRAIPQMLALFEKYEVHVTWATVGMLFNATRSNLLQNAPKQKPQYKRAELSPYHFIDAHGIGEDESQDPFHFAPTLIRTIAQTPFQEIGTHTYSHYYCNEEGQTVEQFSEDLRAAQRVASLLNITLRSLVFPRNQFNDSYLRSAFDQGITSFRSNPSDWFWHIHSTMNESRWKRLNRGLDAYFPIGQKNSYPLSDLRLRKGYPLCLPASRLLRPYRASEYFLNRIKIQRIASEMTYAARNNEVYHLWWHPHNFGNHPIESLGALEHLLKQYRKCQQTYGMQSLNMGEITQFTITIPTR